MIIALPPELETLVNRQVESGRFENAIDAIFAGMNLLGQNDNLVIDRTVTSSPVINQNVGLRTSVHAAKVVDLNGFSGVIELEGDALEMQLQMRNEWA